MNNYTVKILLLAVLIILMSCSNEKREQIENYIDNPKIEKLFLKDNEIRELDAKTDTVVLENYDKIHRDKIFELLATNQVITPRDKFRAALILQHTAAKYCEGQLTSLSPENFLLAYHLSSKALAELEELKDSVSIRKENYSRMIALNYDRYLLYSFGYQKYGTQFVFDNQGEMLLAPIDTTLATNEERKRYNVETLDQLLKKHKMKEMQNK